MITYVKGDATSPQGDGSKIIAHICNDAGAWGAGFVLAVSRRWKTPEQLYRAWLPGGRRLGQVMFVAVEPSVTVANMVAQILGYEDGRPPIRYDALRECLGQVASQALREHASVHLPRIGAGFAGGSWEHVERIINETLCAAGVRVVVYDL